MTPFFHLLLTDPEEAKRQLLTDGTVSFWIKDAVLRLSQRDPVDTLYDLDVLLNLFEAVCDHALGVTPQPHSRIRTLPVETESPPETEIPASVDQFPAEIVIGGTVDRLLVPELLNVIADSSVSLGWETPLFAPLTEPDLCRGLDDSHHLHFYNGFALEGEFPTLEHWLIQHQIGFTRTSSGTGQYQAERVQFRKGLQAAIRVAIDPNGKELLPRMALMKVLQYLKEGANEEATALLEMTVGPPLAALPPFHIEQTLDRRAELLHDERG
jgi:hypothetical protein